MQKLVVLALASAAAVLAQPRITRVANGGSLMQASLAGGSIARGSIFAIMGRNFGPSTLAIATTYPLATTLAGITVKVSKGTAAVDALPYATITGQVNVIMPSNAPLGDVVIQITVNGNSRSNPFPAKVVNSSFGIYTANSGGFGPGILQNFNGPADVPLNSLTTSAKPGQTITLWGTGLGPVTGGDNVSPPIGNLPTPVKLVVGGKQAQITYSGRAPGDAGSDLINFVIPPDTPLGCWVPVYVVTENAVTSNVATMAISADGSPCTDTSHPLANAFAAGSKLGVVTLLRSTIREDVGTARVYDVVTDVVHLDLRSERASQFAYNPNFSLPPPGTCTVYTSAGDIFGPDALAFTDPTGAFLKGGANVSVSGPSGVVSVQRPTDPHAYNQLGFNITGTKLASSAVLNPGSYTVTATGGADVGAINAAITIPSPLNWTNRDQIVSVTRSQGLPITWSAPAGQRVFIYGGGVDLPTNTSGLFYCVAPDGASSFTVPPEILANVPATRRPLYKSKSLIYVGMSPAPGNAATFSAAGLDATAALPVYLNGKTVFFK